MTLAEQFIEVLLHDMDLNEDSSQEFIVETIETLDGLCDALNEEMTPEEERRLSRRYSVHSKRPPVEDEGGEKSIRSGRRMVDDEKRIIVDADNIYTIHAQIKKLRDRHNALHVRTNPDGTSGNPDMVARARRDDIDAHNDQMLDDYS